jgi:predicted transcriptional regulator
MKNIPNTKDLFVSIADVENEIISAIECTVTADGMNEQSEMWFKVYEALQNLKFKSFPLFEG